jgi:unsaturated pyranuronate lyase
VETKWTVERMKDLARRSLFPGVEFRFVAGAQAAIAEGWFTKGAEPMGEGGTHSHEAEELLYVLEGELQMRMGDELEEVTVRSGEVLVIPSNVPHGGRAAEDTHALAVFTPVRTEFDTAPTV